MMGIKQRFWILLYFAFVSGYLTQHIDKVTEINPQHLERLLRRLLHKMDSKLQNKVVESEPELSLRNTNMNSGEDISGFMGGNSNSINNAEEENFREAKLLTKIFLPDSSDKTLTLDKSGDKNNNMYPYRSVPGLPHNGKMRLAKMLMSLVKVSPVSPEKKSMPDFNPTGW